MSDIYVDAQERAKKSRNALCDYLSDVPLNSSLWKLIANSLVDARIEGYLQGLEAINELREMEAYTQGYLAGLDDKIS